MACNIKIWFTASFILLIPLVFGVPQVPCLFIMGDSLFDNGNNNNLVTEAKVNYPPYGIDFPDGPTGRFTNGRNLADFIAQQLGFDKPIPPFATAKGQEILLGVNYASGSAGIRNETGTQLGDNISLNRQLLNHKTTITAVNALLGSAEAGAEYLQKCIYLVYIGSNDYINNYLMPEHYPTKAMYKPDQYATALNEEYSEQLKSLYSYGARKFALFGLALIGCIPAEMRMTNAGTRKCNETINEYVQLFNNGLYSQVTDLNRNLPHAQFIYINVTKLTLADPSRFGITILDVPCCTVSTTIAKGQCTPNQVPCHFRKTHIFWDAFHPTEIANELLAAGAYANLCQLK